ncbi:MAG: glycosyltransferase [Deltaproteobacteria bacterium]|nr:glycosyltransferase [Deltaproteobacteria bacterium]
MNVLFVVSGNSDNFPIAPFIQSQGLALTNLGVNIEYFRIQGKGLLGYLGNVPKLRSFIKSKNFNIIHAHYVLSGWVSVLTLCRLPIICSFMGSDTYGDTNSQGKRKLSSYNIIVLAKFIQPFLNKIIVKSNTIYRYIWLKNKAEIIPNGVNISAFMEIDKKKCRELLGMNMNCRHILFFGDQNNPRKNFFLAKNSYNKLGLSMVEILNPYPVEPSEVPLYMNAGDVVVLSSYLEGSPNVIKEAMACNIPIVSTDVGDVRWVIGDTEGCYISSYDAEDMAKKIKLALKFANRTNGRQRILDLGLDSETIAKRIIELYEKILTKEKSSNTLA